MIDFFIRIQTLTSNSHTGSNTINPEDDGYEEVYQERLHSKNGNASNSFNGNSSSSDAHMWDFKF
jgi:hypothetical protein